MHRKKSIVFMAYNSKTKQTTILPGSLIVENLGKALNPRMVETREEALKSGAIAPHSKGILEVKEPIRFNLPRSAASFAAGTLVKDLSAWKNRKGVALKDSSPKNITTAGAARETIPAEVSQSATEESSTS